MRTCRASMGLLSVCLLLLAADAPLESSAEELIRRANDAFERDHLSEAEQLYQAAEVLTADPGLVAFNRATVLFHRAQKKDQPELYSEAAKQYYLTLSDSACPSERAAKAWYNRGTCLLRQSGATTATFRSAIACLERCLNSDVADPPLRANAAYNLKLAKLLWNEARRKESKEDSPNDNIPPEDPRSEQPPEHSAGLDRHAGNQEPGEGNPGTEMPRMVPQHGTASAMKAASEQGHAPAPGATGQVRPLDDPRDFRSLNPEETRQELHRTAERLRRDRQTMRKTLYGAERTGLHDW